MNTSHSSIDESNPPAPATLDGRFAPLTVAGLPIVRGGYVWDEARNENVWRDEAVTVVMFDKLEHD